MWRDMNFGCGDLPAKTEEAKVVSSLDSRADQTARSQKIRVRLETTQQAWRDPVRPWRPQHVPKLSRPAPLKTS